MKKKILLTLIAVFITLFAIGMINASAATTVNVSTFNGLQSAHPYANNMDKTWVWTEAAQLDAMKITFSEDTEVEAYCDYIYILDANDNQIGKYTGTTLAGKTIEVPGNKFKIRLTSDSSTTKYGFLVSEIELIADGTVLASGSCGSKLNWKLQDNGLLTISGMGNMYNYTRSNTTGRVNTPWESQDNYITSVVIEEGVTSIGSYAFYGCHEIKYVTIPDSVTTIGLEAFKNCSKLVMIDIGSGLTTVESNAFFSCTKLNLVNIKDLKSWCSISFANSSSNPASVAGRLVVNEEETDELVIPEGVTNIKPYVFASLKNTKKIVFPKTLTTIDEKAFYNCNYIEEYEVNSANTVFSSVNGVLFNKDKTTLIKYPLAKKQTSYSVPTTVKTIEDAAFFSADFTSITLNSSLETIKSNAFESCTKLTAITIPSSVKNIGEYAFRQCTALKNATISSEISKIPVGLFYYCKALTGVSIPTKVTSIGNYAFYHCEALTSMTLPDNITSVGSRAFDNCKTLKNIKMPTKLETMGEYCFNECGAVTSISITSPLKGLEQYTFNNCTSLKSVTLPSSLVYIENYCFYNCSNLKSINLPENLIEIGYYCFYNCINLPSITIPDKVYRIYQNTFNGCTSLSEVVFGKNLKEIHFKAFRNCTSLKTVKMGNYITLIDDNVFENCTSLTDVEYGGTIAKWQSITIDSGNSCLTNASIKHTYTTTSANNVSVQYNYSYNPSQGISIVGFSASKSCSIILPDSIEGYPVTIIGDSAFKNCDYLTSIVLPEGITRIDSSAFYGCNNLKSIDISDEVNSIGSYAFAYCSSLENIKIPDSVTEIPAYTFKNASSLKNIIIPSVVKRIGSSAFDSIYNYDNTFNIFYAGTEDEWKKVSIDSFNNIIRNAKNIYYNCIADIDGDLLWVVCDKLLMIIGDKIPDYPTAQAAPWGSYAHSVKTLKLQKNTTQIGNYAFSSCENLKYILYYGTLAEYSGIIIGSNNLPMVKAEKYTDIIATKYIENDIFYVLDSNNVFTLAGSGEIPDYDFSYNQPYGEYRNIPSKVVVKDGITYLGGSAFAYFGNLQTIEIPDSVSAFGTWLFEGCTNLTTINIPGNVKEISPSMFLNCSSLTELEIPRSVTTVNEYAFSGCTYLNKIYYNGTQEEFSQIKVGTNNYPFENANKEFYAYVTFRNTDGSLIVSETQSMGGVISLDSLPFIYGYGVRLYKDSSLKESFDKSDVISENIELYVEYFELPMNRILINGDERCAVGDEGSAYDISFAIDKDASALYFFVKYPEYITLRSVIPKDFEYAGKEDEYSEEGYTTSIILAQYSETALIPQHEIVTPFELRFDVSKDAIPGNIRIEVTEETCLVGNETYFFEERIPGTLEILPKLAENIEIIGEDVISSETTYTAIITPDYTTDKSVEWSVDDETIAIVSENGVVTPVTSGTFTLTATAKDGSGVSASKTITVTRGVTGIEIVGADSITEATTYSVNITPDYATNKEVEWSISNTEIATIDQNGVVNPVTSGLVTVTVTAKDGSGVVATKEINVIKLAESIEITGEDSISSPVQYTATVSPDYTSDKEVSWSVDNEAIATVDELGIVTPVTSGTITLTATAKDGSGVLATKVIEIVKYAESIEIVGEEEITEPTQYNVVILPEYTTNKNAEWSVSDESIATVDENGVVTPLKNGKIVLTAKAEDASGIETTKSIVITVSVRANSITSDVGIWDKEFDSDITEYTINVPDGTTTLYLTSSFTNATAKVNGTIAINGVRKKVSLTGTETNIEIVLTPISGNNLKGNTYTIKVVRGSYTKTATSVDGKSFTVVPFNIENGKTVILALYDGEKFVEMQNAIYEGIAIQFTTTKSYTNAKVMVWDDMTNLKPVCNVEIVK